MRYTTKKKLCYNSSTGNHGIHHRPVPSGKTTSSNHALTPDDISSEPSVKALLQLMEKKTNSFYQHLQKLCSTSKDGGGSMTEVSLKTLQQPFCNHGMYICMNELRLM